MTLEAQTSKPYFETPKIVGADYAAIETRILTQYAEAQGFTVVKKRTRAEKLLDFQTIYGATTTIKDGYVQPRPEPAPKPKPQEQPK